MQNEKAVVQQKAACLAGGDGEMRFFSLEFAHLATSRAGGKRHHSGRAFAHVILGTHIWDAGQFLETFKQDETGCGMHKMIRKIQQSTRYDFFFADLTICFVRPFF